MTVMPGDRIKMTAGLISSPAIEDGMRFAIRESQHTPTQKESMPTESIVFEL